MPAALIRPLKPNSSGFGPQDYIPITGGTPAPTSNDPGELNAWLKAQPWYQAALKAWGLDPDKPTLDMQRRYQVLSAAIRAGAQTGNDFGIAGNGQFESIKTPTAAKIALYAMGAWAGGAALAGLSGGGGAAGAAGAGGAEAGTGGTLASTTIAPTIGGLVPEVAASGAVPAAIGTGGAAAAGGAAGAGSLTGAFAEPATTVGLPAGSAGLPGGVAAPQAVGDLLAGGSAVPGQVAGVAPTVAAPSAAATAGKAIARVLPAAIGNIVGNVVQNHAIDDATAAQIEASKQALAAQEKAGERAIGILSPWANVGGAAVNRLGDLMHLDVAGQAAANAAQPKLTDAAPAPAQPAIVPGGRREGVPPGGTDTGQVAVPRAGGSLTGSTAMATMRAPTGETQSVPLDQVDHFTQRGAVRIG